MGDISITVKRKAFVNGLIEKPCHLDTDYLIFGYIMDSNSGNVVINDLWLNILHKIRPGNWFSERSGGKVFGCAEDFLAAFEETVYQNVETRQYASQWRNKFRKSYRKHYGEDIDFPRWDDIRHKYGR